VARARPLYEGVPVNYNHARNENIERPIEDRAGWLEHVRVDEAGGLTGDLRLLTADPRSGKVLEIAEKNPRLIGLSHAAHGEWTMRDGVKEVHTIDRVESVDLVTDPAAVSSLFESRRVQSQPVQDTADFVKRLRGRFSEGEAMNTVGDNDVSASEGRDTLAVEQVKQAIRDAVVTVLDSGDLSTAEKKAKIGKLIDARDASIATADAAKTSIEKALGGPDQAAKILSASSVNESLRRSRGRGDVVDADDFVRRLQGLPPKDDVSTALRRLHGRA
jgi:hypothetical protein